MNKVQQACLKKGIENGHQLWKAMQKLPKEFRVSQLTARDLFDNGVNLHSEMRVIVGVALACDINPPRLLVEDLDPNILPRT